MTSRFATAVLAVLALNACSRVDPLSIQERPGGGAQLMHVLVGEGTQAICLRASISDPCDEKTADVLVRNFEQVADVQVEWINEHMVEVRVASGQVVRAARSSPDGKYGITVTMN
jgi:hypothetical protein